MNFRNLTYLLIFICSVQLSAQKKIVWFDAGLKAQGGSSALYNKAVFDSQNDNYELGLTSSYSLGGKFGINFEYTGLAIDVLYNNSNSSMSSQIGSSLTAINHKYNSLDIYPLFRNAQNLGYFEIGPKVSFLQNISRSQGSAGSEDVINQFNKFNYSAVIGFGANIIGSDEAFTGILGIRMEYGINDFVNGGDGKRLNAPLNVGSIYDTGYKSTHPIFVGLVFEANWGIGYFGRAKCGARSKFMMF